MADKLYKIGDKLVTKADYAKESAAYSARMRLTPPHMRGVDAIGRTEAKITAGAKMAAQPAPTPKAGDNSKRRGKVLVADTIGSTCFDDLRFQDGTVFATFTDGSQYDYDMTRADAKEWFDDESLGGYFNAEVR